MHRIIGTLLLLASSLLAQAPDTLWTQLISNTRDEAYTVVAQTEDGGLYLAGQEVDTLFGNEILAAMRTDSQGNTIWRRRYLEQAGGILRSALATSDGGLIIGGSAAIDSVGRYPTMLKLNGSGDSLWFFQRDSMLQGGVYALLENSSGSIISCSNGAIVTQNRGVNVASFTQQGQLVWERYITSPDPTTKYEASQVIEAQNGDLFIAGTYHPRPVFPISPQERIWLMRMSASGDSLWSSLYGISDWPHYTVSMSLSSDGNVKLLGLESPNGDEPHRLVLTFGQDGTLLEEHIYDDYVLWDVSACPSFGYIGITETSILDTSTFEVFTVPLLVRLDDNGGELWRELYRMPFPYLGESLFANNIVSLPNGSYSVAGGVLSSNPFFTSDAYVFVTEPDLTSSTDENPVQVPTHFSVSAYPNPFNPSTTISFDMPASSQVKLSVFNTLGQEVAQLTDERFSAGHHEISFSAAHLPSGLYFYSLSAIDQTLTGKLLLLK